MELRVLGCSGGIGGAAQRTTALLLDRDILIDAGSGVGDLSMDALCRIDHVCLTHAHLDHIAFLPLLVDTVAGMRQTPLTVHAPAAVIEALQRHVFNGTIWPDFSRLPTTDAPFMRYRELSLGQVLRLGERTILPLPVDHSVPAAAYRIDSGQASLVFSGDTGPCDAFWQAVNAIDNLRILIIECAFPDRERDLAVLSKHFCPSMLADGLAKLERACDLYITHLKPGQAEATLAEVESCLGHLAPRRLSNGLVLTF
ncbi:3',5'-cyclic-nucleotide phosphodiesterase [Azonexus hydrophilus]|uniref:3',5'-cyclic-nucleotide phosphodiesterase n=1 Tax=Azonexus hydrophilus TaxID=418702 RepID=A0ABZ2XF39_9RHOO